MSDTLKKKKTNSDYLRELIEKHIEGANKDEALEFLEAIDNEVSDLRGAIKDLEDAAELEGEEPEYKNKIETNFGSKGVIKWTVDNILCRSMMEELDDAIRRGVPVLKIENLLRAL